MKEEEKCKVGRGGSKEEGSIMKIM